MAYVPARQARPRRTRGRLALSVILVLSSAAGAATLVASQRLPQASGEGSLSAAAEENSDEEFVDPAATATRAPQAPWNAPPTCGQWRDLLSGGQRTSYSAVQLRAAWRNDGSSRVPPEGTVRAYSSAITAACEGKGRVNGNVSDVARAVYAADPGRWGP